MWNKPWNNVKPAVKKLNQLKTFSLDFQIELLRNWLKKHEKIYPKINHSKTNLNL